MPARSPRDRTWWRRRVLVLFVAAVGTAAIAIGFVLEAAGPAVLHRLGVGGPSGAWRLLRMPASFVVLGASVCFLYRFLPNTQGP